MVASLIYYYILWYGGFIGVAIANLVMVHLGSFSLFDWFGLGWSLFK